MIIYFDIETKAIKRTEDYTNVPILPFNMTLDEQKIFYKSQGESFVDYKTEIGSNVYNYILKFDEDSNFIGLQPK